MNAIAYNRCFRTPGFVVLFLTVSVVAGSLLMNFTKTNLLPVFGYADTTLSVYGPYRIVKLPITKGVKIANPIHLKLGPYGILYAANQTGDVYSLRDTDHDGLEDMALLYCSIKDFGLRSPSGLTHRGDTIYVRTAQQIRAFIDLDKDEKADSSWVVFDKIPNSEHPYEWTTGLSIGPDSWLYFALSTDSWNAAPSPDPNGYRGLFSGYRPTGRR